MVGFRKDLHKLQSKTTFPTDVFPHRLSKTVTLAEILDTAKVGDFDEQRPQNGQKQYGEGFVFVA